MSWYCPPLVHRLANRGLGGLSSGLCRGVIPHYLGSHSAHPTTTQGHLLTCGLGLPLPHLPHSVTAQVGPHPSLEAKQTLPSNPTLPQREARCRAQVPGRSESGDPGLGSSKGRRRPD